jgi:hypothetical protein
MEQLRTTAEVIDALNGIQAVVAITGRSTQAVWNWKNRGVFPAWTYLALTRALAEKGREADPRLFRMIATEAA